MKKTLIIAAIAAIAATSAVSLLLRSQGATRPVVVAGQELPAGTVIEEDMLKVVDIPAAAAVGGEAVNDPAAAIGKTVIIPRATGDLIPSAALGEERPGPAEGSGFLTVTVPSQDATMLKAGDTVAFAIFDGTGGGMLGDFAVLAVAAHGDNAYVTLAGNEEIIIHLAPFMKTRSFVLVRRG